MRLQQLRLTPSRRLPRRAYAQRLHLVFFQNPARTVDTGRLFPTYDD